MLHRIKQFLGIEGIKIKLEIPAILAAKATHFDGILHIRTMNNQAVNSLRIGLYERYTRGRRGNKKTEEILLGEIAIKENIQVLADEPLEIPFTLVFKRSLSQVDSLTRIPIAGKIAEVAKWIAGATSEFYVVAEANVKGTALQPFDKVAIGFK